MVSISKLTTDVDVSEYYGKYVDIEKFLKSVKNVINTAIIGVALLLILILMKSGIRLTNLK